MTLEQLIRKSFWWRGPMAQCGHAMGYLAHDANDTVMKPTGHYNVPNKSAVSADVCAKASSGPVLTKKAGPKDCCMTP